MFEKNIVVGPFQCNCKILACARTGAGILVDPGDEAPRIIKALEGARTANGVPIQIKYLLHTHGHLDHIGATREVKETLTQEKPKIALHRGDEQLYQALKKQGALFGIQYDEPLPIDHYLQDEETLTVGDLRFSILHTPGHSPGSVCIRLHEDSSAQAREMVLSGDTLFQQSIGRTDLWGGNQATLMKSIKQRLLVMDGDTRVCPGHGPDTTIGSEKFNNPFLR